MQTPQEHPITIQTRGHIGELERILRVIRVRGFHIAGFNGQPAGNGMQISLLVQGERCIENLQQQLAKLVDIQSVTQDVDVCQRMSA